MKGLSKFLGRGLLVLALGSCFVACGDDDDGDPTDAGPDAMAGTGGVGGAGRGGVGGAGRGGSAGDSGMAGTGGNDCQEAATEASKVTMSSAKCVDCLCDMRPSATADCTGDCWKLAYCVAASGCMTSDTTCIRGKCVTPLGGMDKYTAAAMLAVSVPFQMCALDCFGPPQDADGGTVDAGR